MLTATIFRRPVSKYNQPTIDGFSRFAENTRSHGSNNKKHKTLEKVFTKIKRNCIWQLPAYVFFQNHDDVLARLQKRI